MKRLLLGALLLLSACHPVPPPVPPAPPVYRVHVTVRLPDGSGASSVMVILNPDLGPSVQCIGLNGSVLCETPTTGGAWLHVKQNGYIPVDYRLPNPIEQSPDLDEIHLVPLPPPLPPPPTRQQALSMQLTFQGLYVDCPPYGRLPWFEAAIAWVGPECRANVYAAKHAAGDTHLVIQLPFGPPLYDEPNQPYSADRFGALDWTAHDTAIDPQLSQLVADVIHAGFVPELVLGGDGPSNSGHAFTELPLVLAALRAYSPDLSLYTILNPGWDSVFYGWTPQQIADFGRLFRRLAPDGFLAIEHNIGHIPLGGGPADWSRSGPMSTYDLVLSEFSQPDAPNNDSLWQVAGRLLGPAYRRPADQPAGDDPTPPWYLRSGTPRGPYFVCAFEWVGEYSFVRGKQTSAQQQQFRQYLRALGFAFTG